MICPLNDSGSISSKLVPALEAVSKTSAYFGKTQRVDDVAKVAVADENELLKVAIYVRNLVILH